MSAPPSHAVCRGFISSKNSLVYLRRSPASEASRVWSVSPFSFMVTEHGTGTSEQPTANSQLSSMTKSNGKRSARPHEVISCSLTLSHVHVFPRAVAIVVGRSGRTRYDVRRGSSSNERGGTATESTSWCPGPTCSREERRSRRVLFGRRHVVVSTRHASGASGSSALLPTTRSTSS